MRPRKLSAADTAEVWKMLCCCTVEECMVWFKCSRTTILRAQREAVKKFGPVKRRGREQYTRWHLTHPNSQVTES